MSARQESFAAHAQRLANNSMIQINPHEQHDLYKNINIIFK